MTIEDTKTIIPYLEAAGIDYVSVSVGVKITDDVMTPLHVLPPTVFNADLAKEVKSTSPTCPSSWSVRINDPRVANTILVSGKADLIGMARQSLADPGNPQQSQGRPLPGHPQMRGLSPRLCGTYRHWSPRHL